MIVLLKYFFSWWHLNQIIFLVSMHLSMIKCRGKTHCRNISKRKFVERGGRIDTPTHKYMTAHFPSLVHAPLVYMVNFINFCDTDMLVHTYLVYMYVRVSSNIWQIYSIVLSYSRVGTWRHWSICMVYCVVIYIHVCCQSIWKSMIVILYLGTW